MSFILGIVVGFLIAWALFTWAPGWWKWIASALTAAAGYAAVYWDQISTSLGG